MKTKGIIILGSILISCAPTIAMAQFGQPARANDVIGSVIRDSQDKKIGTVKDLAVNLNNGRVVEVVVSWGGFLGVDSKLVAAAPDSFSMAPDNKTVRFSADRKTLEGAPAVDLSKWKEDMQQARIENVYQYYGLTPYFLVEQHPGRAAAYTMRLGEVERASKLIGLETMNRQDETLGKVNDMIVDLPQGRVIEVMINSGRVLGIPDELSAVPPQILQLNPERDLLILDTTKERLTSVPHFSSRAWPQINRGQATDVYQAYHVAPYFLAIGTESATVSSKTPMQGTSQSDLEITARIQKNILAADGLSADARAVKIITMNGRVTLRGTVDNPDEKRRVADIAAAVVRMENVDNQLQIKEAGSSASN